MRKRGRIDPSKEVVPTVKVILAGDAGVGKTTFLRRHWVGDFSMGQRGASCSVASIVCTTSRGRIQLDCWDTHGQERFGAVRDGYFIGAKAAIIMFDLTCSQNISMWNRDIHRVCGDIPMCIVGNKADIADGVMRSAAVRRYVRKGLNYTTISNFANYNTHAPLELLASALLEDPFLTFYPGFPPKSLAVLRPEQLAKAEKCIRREGTEALPSE